MTTTKTLSFFLIDDDQDDVFLFQDVLNEVAPQIAFDSAANGLEGIEALEAMEELPSLIFLDLNMPVMEGKECLYLLKNSERLSTVPVIMYSTSSQSSDIEETLLHGAICFITKPDSVKELKEIVTVISKNVNANLEKSLRILSNNVSTFIVC